MPMNGIAGSSGSTMSNFLRNHHSDFQSGFTSLQSQQQWRSVPFSPHPLEHLLSPELFILVILTCVRWNLRVVLICISLITNVEHFFGCFRAILVLSVENSLFSSIPHFNRVIWLSGGYLLEFFVYTLDINPLSDVGFLKIFSQFVGCCFVLLTVSFALQKLCSFMRSHLLILVLRA